MAKCTKCRFKRVTTVDFMLGAFYHGIKKKKKRRMEP